jgi:hypothetical protein
MLSCGLMALINACKLMICPIKLTTSSIHLLDALEVDLDNLLINVVVAVWGNVRNVATGARWQHDAVLHKRVLKHHSIDVTRSDAVADLTNMFEGKKGLQCVWSINRSKKQNPP